MKKLSKNTKTLIFSASGLLVLIAAVIALVLTQEKPEIEELPEQPAVDPRLILSALTADDVKIISVINQSDDYTIERLGVDLFDMAVLSAVNAPADEIKLGNAARYASGLRARDIVEESAKEEDFAKYGLAENSEAFTAMRVEFNDGTSLEIYIGNETPTTEPMTYIRKAGDNMIYTIWTYYVSLFKEDRRHYVSLNVTPSYDEAGTPDVEKLIIECFGDRHVIEMFQKADENDIVLTLNLHRFTEPIDVVIDYTDGFPLVHGMFGLTAGKVAYTGSPEEMPDTDVTGFDEPSALIEMTANGKKSTLTLGNVYIEFGEGENDDIIYIYGVHSDIPGVLYLFLPEQLPWYDINIEKIMAGTFHMPFIFGVSDLTAEVGGKVLNFTFSGESVDDEAYYLDGELVDTSAFKKLYQFIIGAPAENLFKGNAEDVQQMPLSARISYQYRGSRPDDVIEFYDAGNRRCVIAFNGVPTYTSAFSYVAALENNINAFLNNEEVVFNY
ncbi:MAG: DUF4340 domain-containing protein [Oscillospiraceae bacterium]|nr:DUF4340 domain-containing protein [Oscillospiraceae bacterium]